MPPSPATFSRRYFPAMTSPILGIAYAVTTPALPRSTGATLSSWECRRPQRQCCRQRTPAEKYTPPQPLHEGYFRAALGRAIAAVTVRALGRADRAVPWAMHARKTARDALFPSREDDAF